MTELIPFNLPLNLIDEHSNNQPILTLISPINIEDTSLFKGALEILQDDFDDKFFSIPKNQVENDLNFYLLNNDISIEKWLDLHDVNHLPIEITLNSEVKQGRFLMTIKCEQFPWLPEVLYKLLENNFNQIFSGLSETNRLYLESNYPFFSLALAKGNNIVTDLNTHVYNAKCYKDPDNQINTYFVIDDFSELLETEGLEDQEKAIDKILSFWISKYKHIILKFKDEKQLISVINILNKILFSEIIDNKNFVFYLNFKHSNKYCSKRKNLFSDENLNFISNLLQDMDEFVVCTQEFNSISNVYSIIDDFPKFNKKLKFSEKELVLKKEKIIGENTYKSFYKFVNDYEMIRNV